MCGIVGQWNRDGRPVDVAALQDAVGSMAHRGPDGEGYVLIDTGENRAVAAGGDDTPPELGLPHIATFAGGSFDLAFGHRRLAILDPSTAGHQPMGDAKGNWLVHSGEIYNYRELARRLGMRDLQSSSDTEVLLRALASDGSQVCGALDGMWAFAWWDASRRRLILSRDRYGMKPLHVQVRGQAFTFASEIGAILALDAQAPSVDERAAYDFLAWGMTDHDARTMFAGIEQVRPGATLAMVAGSEPAAEVIEVTDVPREGPEESTRHGDDLVAEVADGLAASITLRLRSDVAIGTGLSGGVDSSSVLSLMRRSTDGPLRTFTSVPVLRGGAQPPSIDERRYADLVARSVGAEATWVETSSDGLVAHLGELHRRQEAPIPSTSAFAQWEVTRAAADAGVSVLMDGQGGDEVFSGYPRALDASIGALVARGRLTLALREARLGPEGTWTSLRRAIASRSGRAQRAKAPPWLTSTARLRSGELGDAWRYRPDGSLSDMMRTDLRYRLPALLRYAERSSMAHGVEVRMPFLDDRLIAVAAKLPDALRVREGLGKIALRRSMRGIVPDAVLDRRDKLGFPTPERAWLIDEQWHRMAELLDAFAAQPFVDRGHLDRAIARRHRAQPADISALWRCASFVAWHEVFFGGK